MYTKKRQTAFHVFADVFIIPLIHWALLGTKVLRRENNFQVNMI